MAYCVLTFLMRLTAVWNIFPAVLRSKCLPPANRPACATTALAGICVLLALYFWVLCMSLIVSVLWFWLVVCRHARKGAWTTLFQKVTF